MTAGSRTGARVILEAFEQILQDHLEDELGAITTELGVDALPAPAIPHGYSIDRVVSRDVSPSIRLYLQGSGFIQERHSIGAPRRKIQRIGCTIRYGNAADLSQEARAVYVYAQAIQTLILQYWYAYASTTRLQDVEASSDERSSSIRERYSVTGWSSMGGRSPDGRDEEDDILFDCIQSVYAPISYTT